MARPTSVQVSNEDGTKKASIADTSKNAEAMNSLSMMKSHGSYYPNIVSANLVNGDVNIPSLDADGNIETRSSILTDEGAIDEHFSGSSLSDDWTSEVGSGASISVSDSILTISSGTTINSETYIAQELDYCPVRVNFYFKISQRIANQIIYFELSDSDTPSNDTQFLRFRFQGTDATKVYCEAQSSTDFGAIEGDSTELTLPNLHDTSDYKIFSMCLTNDGASFFMCDKRFNGCPISVLSRHYPSFYTPLYVRIRVVNGGSAPASSTNVLIDYVKSANVDRISIENPFVWEAPSVQLVGYEPVNNVRREAVISNNGVIAMMPFLYTASQGALQNVEVGEVLGNQISDFSSSNYSTVGSTFNEPHTDSQPKIVSSSSSDSSAGTGARKVKVVYLDSDWNLKYEIVTMNGTSAVTMSATDVYHIEELVVVSSGTNNSAIGTVSLKSNNLGTTYITIIPNDTKSSVAFHHVPAGYTDYIFHWEVSCIGGTGRFRLFYEEDYSEDGGDINQEVSRDSLASSNGDTIIQDRNSSIKVLEKKHVRVGAKGSSAPDEYNCIVFYWREKN